MKIKCMMIIETKKYDRVGFEKSKKNCGKV
jgi:hypothetical protein